MKKAKKAVLLSAFILPGLGHVFLKRYVMGMVLIGIALLATYSLIVKTVERSLHIIDNIQSGAQLSVADIASLVSHQSVGVASQLLDMGPLMLLICWLIGIVDSYRIGRAQDKIVQTEIDMKKSMKRRTTRL